MPLLNPIYLDAEMIDTVAHFLDIEFPVQTEVEESGVSGVNGEGGFSGLGMKAGIGFNEGTEMRQRYTVQVNALKVANDVIQAAEDNGHIKDMTDSSLRKGDLVRFDAELLLSDASEVGNIMARFLPVMAAGGGEITDNMKGEIMSNMFGAGQSPANRQLFIAGAEEETDSDDRQMLVSIEPAYFFRNNTFEDLEREVTIFGHVERVIADGRNVSLDRWLLPDMDRAARRALKGKGLAQMLEKIKPLTPIDVDKAMKVTGPAVEIRPIVVY